ncbi:MAG: PepSY domain-containing protein [Oscillospiraceae bacterium]
MKKMLIAILAASCIAAMSGCAVGTTEASAAPSVTPTENTQLPEASIELLATPVSSTMDTTSFIGEAAAKTAALNHAGLAESKVTFIKAKLERDDGRMIYDVEFYSGNAEYDYEIDAYTGKVLSYDYDVENYSIAAGGTQSSQPQSSAGQIGEAAAKTAALNHAGLAETNVTFIKTKLDYDDGRTVYDVEFYSGNAEYDYEVDAYTGKILSYDYDVENYSIAAGNTKPNQSQSSSNTSSASTNYIGEAAAKTAALNRVGLSNASVTFTKVKLDRDDGTTVYEIEFVSGTMEYEFEINAFTGAVTSYDVDSIYD